MAEETEVAPQEAPPKKGGSKLVIIVVAVIMLVTGGFVGLKMKTNGAKVTKRTGYKVELGTEADSILEVHEFLVNMPFSQDGSKFLRTDISVQTAKGFDKNNLTVYLAPVQDAINQVLCKYTSEEIQQVGFRDKLKREVALAANNAMEAADPKMRKEREEKEKLEGPPIHHPEWDSDTGPILKVYYTSFAFQ
jgi:flagellar basal body-associated protein FliL